MDLHTWFLYVTVAIVAIVSPGPAILLAIHNSVMYDMKAVVFSTLGNVLGLFTLSSAAMLGLGVVLKTSAVLFLMFKILGALYLIYIGVKQFRNLSNVFEKISLNSKKSKSEYFAIFSKGYLVCVSNPKPIIFFTALFPLFLNTNASLVPQFFILTFTFMTLSYMTLMSYAFFAKNLKSWFSHNHRATWFNRISGAFFVALGVSLLGLERK
ncbi:LysE family translocator [Sulfurospirillum barnesii]|uniref:Putative threonine efflux protein n=1 Tax=Sulfurospirillum barnesii (strain ATCC 700032 / DSM 10660 / SES-3) TaxID=760154 RepID=I3XXJ1_SULBS|nr:LysE family translocator [Sulfurospirillum barnesii]AFL68665.1 putative threonine efflux protein [Sulfurospirillum barnesii SES-3]